MRAKYFSAMCLAALLTLTPVAIAQHQHSAEKLIDGSAHPELISDTTAYRLFLATYSGTDVQHRKVQSALFGTLRFSQEDQLVMTTILNDFSFRFHQMLDDDAEEVAERRSTDHTTFIGRRDGMMDDILRVLKLELSKPGFERLDGYVQNEKRKMRISPELERKRQ